MTSFIKKLEPSAILAGSASLNQLNAFHFTKARINQRKKFDLRYEKDA